MKKVFCVVMLLSAVATAFSQKTSLDNYTGAWENNASWTTSPAPDNIVDTELDLTINGYITRTGDLNVWGDIAAGDDFIINDTLVILGDVFFPNDAAELIIGPNALLIVIGNMTFGNNTVITNDGVFAVSGNLDFANGASDIYTGGGELFVQGVVTRNPAAEAADNWDNLQTIYPNVYDFIQCGGGSSCSLPVKLSYFNATLKNGAVELMWATIMEEDFQKFVIQRSQDGMNYEDIGEVAGKGFNIYDIETTYSFVDRSPLLDVNYYRLKAVDLDDSFEYFRVKMVRVEGVRILSAFPNPSSGNDLSFSLNFNPEESDRIVVIDQMGVEVFNAPAASAQSTITFSAPLSPGVYILKYRSATSQQATRVVVTN